MSGGLQERTSAKTTTGTSEGEKRGPGRPPKKFKRDVKISVRLDPSEQAMIELLKEDGESVGQTLRRLALAFAQKIKDEE